MDATTAALAQAIAALGGTGVLAFVFVLWITGKLHSDPEVTALKATHTQESEFHEKLRMEAVTDRQSADKRVDALTSAVKDSNDLTRRALDLNERLFDEFISTRKGGTVG